MFSQMPIFFFYEESSITINTANYLVCQSRQRCIHDKNPSMMLLYITYKL